ncbi:hypothetical protein JCM10908_006841 [Rhodotorula pacifica]|uniref:uncharacterized protein n=1 Tax=Rhodotorula pacifica TaxID=1495444 RepID=UPI00316C7A01
MTSAAPPDETSSLLLRLPNELLEEIVKHLLPRNSFEQKPVEAVRLGSTCQRLHDLMLVIREHKGTNAWLADYLVEHGHLVRRLSVHLYSPDRTDGASISICVKRCPNRIDVKLGYVVPPVDNPLFAVFSAIVRPELKALDIGVASLDTEHVQLAARILRSCGQLISLALRFLLVGIPQEALVNLFAGALLHLRVNLEARWSGTETPAEIHETVTPAVLPHCTDVRLSGSWAKQVLTQGIHPGTPLHRVHYRTVAGAPFDNDMPQVIQSFHANQPVKTLAVVRFKHQQPSSAIRIAERDQRAEQLRRFEDWGRAVGVQIEAEDVILRVIT